MTGCHLGLCLKCLEQLVLLELGIQAQAMINVDRTFDVLAGIKTEIVLLVVSAGCSVLERANPGALWIQSSLPSLALFGETSTTSFRTQLVVHD